MYLTHRWNIPYQYELNRVAQFKYLALEKSLPWDYSVRPLDSNAEFESIESVDLSKYEALVLHFDENVVTRESGHQFFSLLDLPIRKILVCHGAPPLVGRFDPSQYLPEESQVDVEAQKYIEGVIGDHLVVLPNHAVHQMWAFKNGTVIEPTLSYQHYPYVKKTMDRAITVSPNPSIIPQYSGYHLLKQSCTGLDFCDLMGHDTSGFINTVSMPQMSESYTRTQGIAVEDLSRRRFYDYMSLLGSYACYFNANQRNPWTTSIHEAMLLGTAVVTTDHFGESRYIKNGYDGFIAKDALEMRNCIIFLAKNFETSVVVGQRARERAIHRFRNSDFQVKWGKVLSGK